MRDVVAAGETGSNNEYGSTSCSASVPRPYSVRNDLREGKSPRLVLQRHFEKPSLYFLPRGENDQIERDVSSKEPHRVAGTRE